MVRVKEDQEFRLNPTESLEFLAYLDSNRTKFEEALPQEATRIPGSREWYGQKLAEAFDNMPE